MLHEFGSPAKEIIEFGLNSLVAKKIIPKKEWSFQPLSEFARRNCHIINSSRGFENSEDISKIKTLFGVSSRNDFYGPSRDQVVSDFSIAFKQVKASFPELQGLLLFGSRFNLSKAPRNTKENPSDIDILPIFDNSRGDFISREYLLCLKEKLSTLLINHRPVYLRIPLSLKMAERAGTIYTRLDPSRFEVTPCWGSDPQGFYFIGELNVSKKTKFSEESANKLMFQSLSSPGFRDLKIREINSLYKNRQI
jgi:predicted nucleotidyltransferase